MNWFTEVMPWIGVVIGGANMITAATPSKSDDRVLNQIFGFLNLLAMNFGKNVNADDTAK